MASETKTVTIWNRGRWMVLLRGGRWAVAGTLPDMTWLFDLWWVVGPVEIRRRANG